MDKLQILCGFESEPFEEALVRELKRAGVEPVIHVRYSKESIKEFLEKNTDCSTVVLTEKMGKVKYTAEELAQLTDKRDINVIAIISPRLRGTEYMKTLYTANITAAIFQEGRKGVGPKDVAEQIVNRRSRKDARVYYGIEGQKLDMGTLDEDTHVEYYNRLKSGDFILKSYIDLCSTMTPQQIADFTKKLPKEDLSELGKYEEFHLIIDLLREFGIDLKIKRPKKVMLGFKTKPQLGMNEGGLTFETIKTTEEAKEEKPVTEPEMEEKTEVKAGMDSLSISFGNDSVDVDDIFAMLDGEKPLDKKAPVMPEEEPIKVSVVEKEPERMSFKEKSVSEFSAGSIGNEADRALQEKLKEQERLLKEKEEELAAERAKVNEGEKKIDRYKEELSQKDKQREAELYRARMESVESENDLNQQHEKEMKALLKKQNALEKEMVKRGIYEDDDEGEDVYLSAGGPQFSMGIVILIILVVAAVLALVFLKPMFLTMGM